MTLRRAATTLALMKGNTRKARTLRRDATGAEQLLWSRLRDRRLSGLKFRRQAPIAGFTVDFVCAATRVIVEVDGSQHAGRPQEDAARTAILVRAGYVVIRFWNPDIFVDLDGVLQTILATCRPGEPV